jgi:hypothetical protein
MKSLHGTVKSYRPLPVYSDGILQNGSYSGVKVRCKNSVSSDQVDDENTKRRTASFKTALSKVFCGANRADVSNWETSRNCSDPNSSFESTDYNRGVHEEMRPSSDELPASPSFSSEVSQQVDDWPEPVNPGSPRDVRDLDALRICECSTNGLNKSTEMFLRVVPQFVIEDVGGEHFQLEGVETSFANPVNINFDKGSIERRRLVLERKRKSLEGRISAIRANYSSTGTQATHVSIASSESSHGTTCSLSNSDPGDKVVTSGDKGGQLGMSGTSKVQIDACSDHWRNPASSTFVDHVPSDHIENVHQRCRPQDDSVWKLEVSPKVPSYYSGTVAHGCLPQGRGLMKFANGDTYDGTFKHGQMHGPQGVYVWSNGSVYKGDFVNNMPHGHGEYRMEDERWYVGNFERGIINGYGEAYSKVGTLFHKGQWKNGIPDHKYFPFIRYGKDDQSSRLSIPVACDASSASTNDPSVSIYERPSVVGRRSRCLSKHARPYFSQDSGEDSMGSQSGTSSNQDMSHSDASTATSEPVIISRTMSIHLAVKRLRKRIDMLEQERRFHLKQEVGTVDWLET